MQHITSLLCFVLVLSLTFLTEPIRGVDVTFFNPSNQTWLNVHFDTPASFYISPSFSVIAQIAIVDPPYACQPLSNLTGKIALASLGFCSIETKARNVQAGGAVAVIIEEGYVLYPGLRAFIIDGTSVNDIKIGVTFIRKQDGEQLTSIIRNYTRVTALLTSTDPNYWRDVTSSPFNITVAFFLAACGIGIASFAMFKIYWFLKIRGLRFEAPLLCLTLYFISSAVLGIYMIFHGIHYGFRPIISFAASSVLLGLTGYVVFIALAIVVFHWHDAMKKVKIEKPWLRRLSVPMLIIAFVLFATEIATGLLAGFYITDLGVQVNVVIYLISLTSTTVLFIVVGFQIRHTLRKQHNVVVRRVNRVQRFTNLILFTSVWLVLFTISSILYVTPIFLDPAGFVVLIFAASFFAYLTILTQIYIFRRPESAQTTPSSSSKRSGAREGVDSKISTREKTQQQQL